MILRSRGEQRSIWHSERRREIFPETAGLTTLLAGKTKAQTPEIFSVYSTIERLNSRQMRAKSHIIPVISRQGCCSITRYDIPS